ncbi:MAG: hypothetical protein CHACPFDD_01245 [Phycisphaerae bacterium]|nr:hypothetical protein [Phycisphaerae bacterium]
MTLLRTRRRRGFTLVELLAVVAIIALLLGILIPSLGAARRAAKKTKSQGQVSALQKASEMFHNDMDRYPKSAGSNPFESGTGHWLSGSQWFLLELIGADMQGYVKPDDTNDSDRNGVIDEKDWRDWYSATPKRQYPRLPLYIPPDGETAMSPEVYVTKFPRAAQLPAGFGYGSSEWKNSRLPFFVDAFGFPILYYAANTAEKRNAVWKGGDTGRYDQSDNSMFTGGAGDGRYNKSEPGWDLTGLGQPHALKELGWNGPNNAPDKPSFTGEICNVGIFNNTSSGSNKGRVWPQNPDSFLIITPGADGLFGTADDVRNFTVGG